MDKRILVVDDEKSISNAIAYALRREGFTVEVATDGEEALQKTDAFEPHVLVLDVMMPKMNGFDVCRKLKNRHGVGILLLTVKNDIIDKVLGLELGADDYMTKPFDLRELVARVKALWRRVDKSREKESEDIDVFAIGGVVIHVAQRIVRIQGSAIELTPKEFDLLAMLGSHPGRVYSRDSLLELLWGMEYAGGTRTVDIHIQRIRKKLGPLHQHIVQTVFSIGYKASGEAGCELT